MTPKKKGRIVYVPPVIIDEVDDIIKEEKINTRAKGMKKLVEYARVGREANRLMRLDFSHSPLKTPVSAYSDTPQPIPWGEPIKKGRKKKK